MSNRTSLSSSPSIFFLLVFILSVPFWLLDPLAGQFLHKRFPVKLPISALMFITPLLTASILTYKEKGSDGVKELLKRAFDDRVIKRKRWYVPVFFFMPFTYVLAYGLMRLSGASLPGDPQVPILMLPVFFLVFFVAAVGEEVGWSGYAIDRLQDRWNALQASIILGIVWAVLHIVPDIQNHQMLTWIAWQRLYTLGLRIIMVWIYNNTGRSVFATIVFHTMDNVSFSLFPNYGSHYDPFFVWLVITIAAVMVTFIWGPKTLARYRYARVGKK